MTKQGVVGKSLFGDLSQQTRMTEVKEPRVTPKSCVTNSQVGRVRGLEPEEVCGH